MTSKEIFKKAEAEHLWISLLTPQQKIELELIIMDAKFLGAMEGINDMFNSTNKIIAELHGKA